MPHEKIRKLREKVQRREQSTRAARRARARRINREEPESTSEKAAVKAKRAKERAQAAKEEATETVEETKALGKDAKTLLATELGVSKSEAESLISRGAAAVERARQSDALDRLDTDGDGDTDILSGAEDALSSGRGGVEGGETLGRVNRTPEAVRGNNEDGFVDPTEPVIELGGLTDPGFPPEDVEDPIEGKL